MSSEKYHSTPNSVSSTQLKTILEDATLFYEKYIAKTIDKEEADAFGVGTYFHTAILEPHLLDSETIVYTKGYRTGADWEKFKKKHAGKAILTPAMQATADKLVSRVKESATCSQWLEGIKPEISLFTELVVLDGKIYAPEYNKVLTLQNGWIEEEYLDHEETIPVRVIVKVRADALGDTFVADLKSTSGDTRSRVEMAEKISHYDYDLSAALYLDLFSLVRPKVDKFVWIFASKDKANAHPWIASPTNILVGRAKWMTAIREYAKHAATNWNFETEDYLEPEDHQLSWLMKVKG